MELADLDNLSAAELRKLITLVARQTTLRNYQHKCSDQRYCSACRQYFCYACYNLHIANVHGPQLAAFNGKLEESSSLFLPEKREVKPKTTKIKIKVKLEISARKPRKEQLTLREIIKRAKAGLISKEQIGALLQELEKE